MIDRQGFFMNGLLKMLPIRLTNHFCCRLNLSENNMQDCVVDLILSNTMRISLTSNGRFDGNLQEEPTIIAQNVT